MKTFGIKVEGSVENLVGYQLSGVEIIDEHVLKTSGAKYHLIIRPTSGVTDVVNGTVFKISEQELEQTDEYEVDDYKRVVGECESGLRAWVYVAVGDRS